MAENILDNNEIMIAEELITNQIYHIRGQKVMLDSELAILYGVETKRLNEQIKRNEFRFPPDFMFRLSNGEWDSLRSQFATSKKGKGGNRYNPLVFYRIRRSNAIEHFKYRAGS